MKVIVAGSRNIGTEKNSRNQLTKKAEKEKYWIFDFLSTIHRNDIDELVCGMAQGPDLIGKEWALSLGKVGVKEFPADWKGYGKAAGFIRNGQMAAYADALIAFWDGNSRGTDHMIHVALEEGLEIHVYQTTRQPKGV